MNGEPTRHDLLVEPDPALRLMVSLAIDEAGYGIHTAGSVSEAIIVLNAQPDLSAMVLDARLPGPLDFPDAVALMRDAWPAVRLIVTLTGPEQKPEEIPNGPTYVNKTEFVEQVGRTLKRAFDDAPGAY